MTESRIGGELIESGVEGRCEVVVLEVSISFIQHRGQGGYPIPRGMRGMEDEGCEERKGTSIVTVILPLI